MSFLQDNVEMKDARECTSSGVFTRDAKLIQVDVIYFSNAYYVLAFFNIYSAFLRYNNIRFLIYFSSNLLV